MEEKKLGKKEMYLIMQEALCRLLEKVGDGYESMALETREEMATIQLYRDNKVAMATIVEDGGICLTAYHMISYVDTCITYPFYGDSDSIADKILEAIEKV